MKSIQQQQKHQFKSKVIHLNPIRKKKNYTPLNYFLILLIFLFFIILSLNHNNLFLKEMLVLTSVIGLLFIQNTNAKV